jgi:hypothetical protein
MTTLVLIGTGPFLLAFLVSSSLRSFDITHIQQLRRHVDDPEDVAEPAPRRAEGVFLLQLFWTCNLLIES